MISGKELFRGFSGHLGFDLGVDLGLKRQGARNQHGDDVSAEAEDEGGDVGTEAVLEPCAANGHT